MIMGKSQWLVIVRFSGYSLTNEIIVENCEGGAEIPGISFIGDSGNFAVDRPQSDSAQNFSAHDGNRPAGDS